MGVVSSERIFKVFDTPAQTVPHGDVVVKNRPQGAVEFRNVWFAYKEDQWVLRGISFRLKADETIALVGGRTPFPSAGFRPRSWKRWPGGMRRHS